MNYSVYIRPNRIEDAQISYQWRNNPKIWKYTGFKADKYVSPEVETEWMKNVLQRENEKRFAICLTSDDRYIGNIFFTKIKDNEAFIEIFIGEVEFWGKGRAYEAACQILEFGFETLKLEKISAEIQKRNAGSIAVCKMTGFKEVGESDGNLMLAFTKQMYYDKEHIDKPYKKATIS